MSELKACPKCGKMMGYNSYFGSYYCTNCGWMGDPETYSVKIPGFAAHVLDALAAHGYEAYVVGGCVRDTLLGKEPHDWDVCTNALPEEVMAVFPDTIPTGLKHGTVTVPVDKELVEVTTFRSDGSYTDHRHPAEVKFVSSINEDLARRDFTVNAMAFRSDGTLIDPFSGKESLWRKGIQCVGDPDTRFQEDALRILRVMRFASVLGFEIEPETFDAMKRQVHLLKFISAERIQSELRKMITGQNIRFVLLRYHQIFTQIIPEFAPCINFNQHSIWHCYDVYSHIANAVGSSPSDELVRLALLFHDIGKPACFQMGEDGHGHFHGHGDISAKMADEIMSRLRFDNETHERVVKLILHHDVRLEANLKTVRRWVMKIGREDFGRFLHVRRADILAQSNHLRQQRLDKCDLLEELYHEVLKEKPLMSVRDLAINGHDVMMLGYQEGPDVGKVLAELLENVLNGNVKNEKEALLNFIK